MKRKPSMIANLAGNSVKWLVLAAALVTSAALSACNTTEGAGKDLKSVGKGIEEAASDAKD